MTDSSNTPPSEETSEVTPNPKVRTENLTIKWIEVLSKVVIAIVGVGIAFIGHEYQQNSMNTQLLLQQERGDIEIRAEMFGKITERLMKSKTPEQDSIIEDALLAQVLALNFHELIELKPLMLHLDRRLSYKSENLDNNDRFKEEDYLTARKELISIANRIRDRQVSSLTNSNQEEGFLAELFSHERRDGRVEYITATQRGYKEHASCASEKDDYNACLKGPIYIDDFKKNRFISVSVDEIDDNRDTFEIAMKTNTIKPPKVTDLDGKEIKPNKINSDDPCPIHKDKKEKDQRTNGGLSRFSVTNYDFPLTDNTLDANGNRYAVFIDKVCKTNKDQKVAIQSVRIGVLFFPNDYYPTRERPINTRQMKEKIEMFE